MSLFIKYDLSIKMNFNLIGRKDAIILSIVVQKMGIINFLV